MGQIVDDIMFEIENTNTRQSVINAHIAEKIVRWVLLKHLEPQKKAECEHNFVSTFGNAWTICSKCWKKIWLSDVLPQQEDKKIELINMKFVEWGERRSPISRTDMCNKINEIITYLNNR